jgi:hypothetical protein
MPPTASAVATSTTTSQRLRRGTIALLLTGVACAVPALADHPAGACPPTPAERCELWSATVDDATPGNATSGAPARSDQFSVATLTTRTTVIAVVKDVAFDPASPYTSSGRAMVVAFDRTTGAQRWTARRTERAYLSPHAATVSPDGSTLFVTGAAYDGYPIGATDSRISTTAYDVATGHELWTNTWDARPDGTDNGNYITVSPDGAEVYVAGVTTAVGGGLDYVTIAYAANDGRQLWSQVYSGVKPNADDAVFGIAVDRQTDMVYVTGWSAGTADYDNDYATVAYALGHTSSSGNGNGNGQGKGHGKGHDKNATTAPTPGQLMWVARYDGIGAQKSDRANAITVDPTGSRVFVSGDSYRGPGGADYGYGTVAYDARTGAQLWQATYNGGRGGFNSATTMVASATTLLVTGQATAPTAADGNDATTVAYDVTTGAQQWVASVAPMQQDDFSRDLQLSPDGRTAYLVSSDTPLVSYTALTRMTVTAYDVATGTVQWQSVLDGGPVDALSGQSVAVAPDGAVSVAGDLKRSANPLGSTTQNIYDVVVAAFAP